MYRRIYRSYSFSPKMRAMHTLLFFVGSIEVTIIVVIVNVATFNLAPV